MKMISLKLSEFETHTNKAHGYDDIPIRMINICDKPLLEPLIASHKNSTKPSHYPDIWKRSNVIPVHKKNDK